MVDREHRIKKNNKYINLLNDTLEDNKITTEECIKKIFKKFKLLKTYKYIEPSAIRSGDIVRTVNLDETKLSIPAYVLNVIKHNDADSSIQHFVVKNNYKNIVWKIKPQKYYIFKAKTTKDKLIELTNMDKILLENINKYKESYAKENYTK